MYGALKGKFEGSQADMAEAIRSSLVEHTWTVTDFNRDTQKVTGARKTTIHPHGIPQEFEYRVDVVWSTEKDRHVVTITINDESQHATKFECTDLCARLFGSVDRNLVLLKKAPPVERTTYGAARWATFDEMKEAGYIQRKEDVHPRSLIVAPAGDEHYIAIPPAESIRHSLVCGPTGTGKTSSFIYPQAVLRLNTSAIFTEATSGISPPDVFTHTARWRKEQGGHEIYYFNPTDTGSDQFNVIDVVDNVSAAIKIAELIVDNTVHGSHKGGNAEFFDKAEKHLLTAAIIHAAGVKSNLTHIRQLFGEGARDAGKEIAESPFELARTEYEAFLKLTTETLRQNIMIGARQRLNPWLDPVVAVLTGRTSIDLEALANQLFSFYLAVDSDNQEVKPVATLALNFLLSIPLNKPLKHDLMLVLDEFTNFGGIPGFYNKMGIIRHRGIGVTLGFQNVVQLESVYGKDNSKMFLSQPVTRMFLKPNDLDTAKSVSEMLGTRTHYERRITANGGIQEIETGVPLLQPADVMSFPPQKAILFIDKMKFMVERFDPATFDMATSLPPLARKQIAVQEKLMAADAAGVQNMCASEREREEHERKQEPEPEGAREFGELPDF